MVTKCQLFFKLIFTGLRGKFTEGNLEGKIIIDYYDGTTFEGLAKDGVFHGICRYVIELLFFLDIFYDFLD